MHTSIGINDPHLNHDLSDVIGSQSLLAGTTQPELFPDGLKLCQAEMIGQSSYRKQCTQTHPIPYLSLSICLWSSVRISLLVNRAFHNRLMWGLI